MDKQAQHTPGPPAQVAFSNCPDCGAFPVQCIAAEHGQTLHRYVDLGYREQRDALLEALHSIEKLAACGLHPDPDHAAADLAAIAATASAALAKARGGA